MKNLIRKNIWFAFFLLITVISLFVRFYHYKELVVFSIDPPFHLMEAREMVESGKIRLTGPMFQSKMVDGRGFFSGPIYYYLLAILGFVTGWNVFLITGIFTFFWIATFAVIFFWLKKRFGPVPALLVYLLLSVYPRTVSYSRMIWNPHFLPLFGTLFLLFLDLRRNKLFYFLAGLCFGIAFNAHYSAVLWVPVIIWVIIREIKAKNFLFQTWFIFVLGAIVPQIPLILFELRHNFYNFRTLFFQLRYHQPSPGYTFAVAHYYLFTGMPVLGFVLGWLLNRIEQSSIRFVVFTGLLLISFLFLKRDLAGEGQKAIYENNWSIMMQQKVADLIIKDGETNYEVAAVLNSDTRSMALRWWLRSAKYQPMSVIDYDKTRILYFVTTAERPPEEETVWEVSAIRPFEIAEEKDLGNNLFFYKLVNKN